MTCIVGLVEKGTIYMGGDSCVSYGWHTEQLASFKVFKVGPFLMGSAGDLRMNNILRYELEIPPQLSHDTDDDRYMVTAVAGHIRTRCKDLGFAKVDSNHEEFGSGNVLIGYRGNIYQMGSDYSIARNINNLAAIGSGYPFALGALAAMKKRPPKVRIRRALEIAAEFAHGVDRTINIEVISQVEDNAQISAEPR